MKKFLKIIYDFRDIFLYGFGIIWFFRLRYTSWDWVIFHFGDVKSIFTNSLYKMILLLALFLCVFGMIVSRNKNNEFNMNKAIYWLILDVVLIIITALIWIFVK